MAVRVRGDRTVEFSPARGRGSVRGRQRPLRVLCEREKKKEKEAGGHPQAPGSRLGGCTAAFSGFMTDQGAVARESRNERQREAGWTRARPGSRCRDCTRAFFGLLTDQARRRESKERKRERGWGTSPGPRQPSWRLHCRFVDPPWERGRTDGDGGGRERERTESGWTTLPGKSDAGCAIESRHDV